MLKSHSLNITDEKELSSMLCFLELKMRIHEAVHHLFMEFKKAYSSLRRKVL